MNDYIGVKLVQAVSMTLNEFNKYKNNVTLNAKYEKEEGYLVKYDNNYESWSPKEVFENTYMSIDNRTKITENDVDFMIGEVKEITIDKVSTLVKTTCPTGFVNHEVSSCIDPKNYDIELGKEIALKRIKSKIWGHLGFVLQWAIFGLKGE